MADTGHDRVVEFAAGGGYRISFAVPAPVGVALDARGDVWVSSPGYAPDYGLVSVFSPAGRFYTEFGLQPNPGQARR